LATLRYIVGDVAAAIDVCVGELGFDDDRPMVLRHAIGHLLQLGAGARLGEPVACGLQIAPAM
jgi:hypothetical protein